MCGGNWIDNAHLTLSEYYTMNLMDIIKGLSHYMDGYIVKIYKVGLDSVIFSHTYHG